MVHKIKKFLKMLSPFKKKVEKQPEIKVSDLKKKTKADLEKLGRKLGVELDKRQTKDKLIKQIKKASK
jgi:hypothetical protein|tara:strand:+ start:653 stop:856 length:204 start_codon:yes stop_codon:yes gene_type:complete